MGGGSANPLDVFAGSRVHPELFAFLDEQRNVDHGAALEGGGLGRALGGVALHTRVALRHGGDDERGQFDVDRVVLPEQHVDFAILEQIFLRIADLLFAEVELVVGLGVHEDERAAVVVEVLHRPVFDVRFTELLARAEGSLDDLAVAEILDLGAYEGAALAGLHVLEVENRERFAVQFDAQSILEIRGIHGTMLLMAAASENSRCRSRVDRGCAGSRGRVPPEVYGRDLYPTFNSCVNNEYI